MERRDLSETNIGAKPLAESPYGVYVYRLRILDAKHLQLQNNLHSGAISRDQFLFGYNQIKRRREMEVVNAALKSINIGDVWARTSAYNVIVSYASDGSIRPMAQHAFIRVSGIASYLQVLK